MKKNAKYALGIITAAVLLYFFFRGTDWSELARALREADPWLISLGVVLGMATFVVRAIRWRYLLLPLRPVGVHNLFSAVCIGFMAISLLPGRVGEFIRAYALGRRERMKVSSVFATVAVERILDGLTILVYFALFLLLFSFPDNVSSEGGRFIKSVTTGAMYSAPVVLLLVAGMVFCILKPQLAPRMAGRALFFLPEKPRQRITAIVESFVQGFSIFTDLRAMFWAVVYSLLLWVVIALGMWVILLGFHIVLPLPSIFVVVIMVAVGVALPVPGGIGGYHKMFQIGLVHIFGVEMNLATAAVLVCHAAAFVPVTIVGLGYAWREGLSLSTIRAIAEEEKDGAAEGAVAPEREDAR